MDGVPIDHEVAINHVNFALVLTLGGVVLEQVGLQQEDHSADNQREHVTHHVGGVQEGVVDGDDLDGLLQERGTQNEATDAAESIDSNLC